MIELAFGESSAGSLKMAKSMKQGECLIGATAVFGGTRKEQREARMPRYWSGKTLGQIPGVGDRWLFLRIQAMLQSGELISVLAATGDNLYSGIVKTK